MKIFSLGQSVGAQQKYRKSHEFYSAQVADAKSRLVAIRQFAPREHDDEIRQTEYWVEAARTLAALEALYLPGTTGVLNPQMREVAQVIYERFSALGQTELKEKFSEDFSYLLTPESRKYSSQE